MIPPRARQNMFSNRCLLACGQLARGNGDRATRSVKSNERFEKQRSRAPTLDEGFAMAVAAALCRHNSVWMCANRLWSPFEFRRGAPIGRCGFGVDSACVCPIAAADIALPKSDAVGYAASRDRRHISFPSLASRKHTGMVCRRSSLGGLWAALAGACDANRRQSGVCAGCLGGRVPQTLGRAIRVKWLRDVERRGPCAYVNTNRHTHP